MDCTFLICKSSNTSPHLQSNASATANQLIQEREDDVKTMNAMVQYSRTVAIRDAQVREKELVSRKKLLEEKRGGILMEIARIKQVSTVLPIA